MDLVAGVPNSLYRPPVTETPSTRDLGTTLRQIRNERGLSLNQVAEATGISRSLLSLIETGQSDITVGRLSRLTRLYGVRYAEILPEPRHPDPVVVRSDDRVVLTSVEEGLTVEILAPEIPRTMQSLLATFAPGARMTDFITEISEEWVHLLEGRIEIEFADGRSILLDAGDSAYFTSGPGGHRHANLADGVSRLLIVVRRPGE